MSDLALLIIIGVHFVGFWALLWYTLRLRKRLRCLGYCYLTLGDWGIDKLIEERDEHIARVGRERTPAQLLNVEDDFKKHLAYDRKLFAEVGLAPPGQRELGYLLGDRPSP